MFTQPYSLSERIKLIICQISHEPSVTIHETSTSCKEYWRVFERKVLRKSFGPVRVGDDFRIRFNSKLYELLSDMDVVQRINIQRLRWLGYVVRMEEDAPARRVFDAGICESWRRGRACIHRKDQIVEALSLIGVTNWRMRARSRSTWKDVLRQAEIR